MGDRLNSCRHESAHAVVQQILLGDLGEMGLKRARAYIYPVELIAFRDMSREHLAKEAVITEAGIVAEYEMCDDTGTVSREFATSGDIGQLKNIQSLGGFSDDEMAGFKQQAKDMVAEHETAIRRVAKELNIRNKLSGGKVSELMAQVEGAQSAA